MAIRARVERHKCIGAGNCITLAPTAFDWLEGDYGKSDVVGTDSVDEELLRAAAFSCPTAAIILEDVSELLPWQLRGKTGPARRVMKTFMFTDIVGSTNLVEALGDEAWEAILRLAQHRASRGVRRPRRRGDLDDRRRVLRRASTRRTSRWPPRSRSSDASRSSARRRASRPRSGSASTPPTRRRSTATSTARASTRRPASRDSGRPGRSSPASRRSARRIGRPACGKPRSRGCPGPIEIVTVDWR